MSRTSDHRPGTASGFTLAEVIVAAGLSLIVISGILAAYLFLGRNLTRLANSQGQDAKSRHALRQFTNDVGSAVSFATITSSNLTFTVPVTLTNCSTTYGSAIVTCGSTAGIQSYLTAAGTGPAVWGTGLLSLANCATTMGSATVTCTSTRGMQAGVAISGSGVPTNAVVNSITNATTFVMSANATATTSGGTLSTIVKCIPDNAVASSVTNATTFVLSTNATATTTGAALYTVNGVSYTYSTGNATLTRTDYNSGVTTTLLTDIDTSASSGFAYYNSSGSTVSSTASVKEVGFSFATKVGTAAVGTEARYLTISPRVVVHNKAILQ